MQRFDSRAQARTLRRRFSRFEQLEARQLLSVAPAGDERLPASLLPSAAQMEAISLAITTAENATIAPISKNIALPAGMSESWRNRLDVDLWKVMRDPPLGTTAVAPGAIRVDGSGRVQAYIRVPQFSESVVAQIAALGVNVDTSNASAGMVQAWIGEADVPGILSIDGVHDIRRIQYPIPRVTSIGDSIHKSNLIRSGIPGLDGSGVRIGILGFGLDNTAQVVAELPSFTIDPGRPSAAGEGNEGTAMMEIIHDIAPGATVVFSAPDTSLEQIDAINYLVSVAQVDVIVDDLGFMDQYFYGDGPVALAAQAAIAAGVVYVSAAGNDGTSHYQGQYYEGLIPDVHEFIPDVANIFPFGVPLNGKCQIVLQWSDPWGNSNNDYDFVVARFTPGQFETVATSVNEQTGAGSDPYEVIEFTNTIGASEIFVLQIVKSFGAPRDLEFYLHGISFVDPTFIVRQDSVYGPPAADGVLTVGAANASSTAFADQYSSQGPLTTITNYTTQTKAFRSVVDGLSVDGVNTAVGLSGLFDQPFLGTSSAAAHVGGIVALMVQANPGLTPQQVTTVLDSTATDLSPTGYDPISGYGLFSAYRAVLAVFTPAPPHLSAATDTGISGSDGITNNTSPEITGNAPGGSYVRLFQNGLDIDSVQLGESDTSYHFNLSELGEGSYQFTVNVAPDSFTPLDQQSVRSAPFTLTIDTTSPSAPATPDLDNSSSDPDGDNFTTDISPVFNVSGTAGSYWAIYRNGAEVSGPPVAGSDGKKYKGPGDGSEELPTQATGAATFTVRARDAAGNESADSAGLVVTLQEPVGLVVTNTLNSGPGSLRAAIVGANDSFGADSILFDIPGAGPQTIALTAGLPSLADPATFVVDAGDEVQIGTFAGNFSFGNYPGLAKAGAGKLVIGGNPVHSPNATLTVSAGTLQLAASERFSAITIDAGAKLAIASGGNRVLQLDSLSIGPTGRLDVADNDLVVHATAATRLTTYAQVSALVASGIANFTWTGPGIESSAAASDPTLLTGVGVMLNDNGFGGPYRATFSGVTVGINDTLVKYTYYGDADLSGFIDGTDYALIDNGFNARLAGWFNGDFDYSGPIDGTDYALIDNGFNSAGAPLAQSYAPPAVAEAPDPARQIHDGMMPVFDPTWQIDPAGIDEGLVDLIAGAWPGEPPAAVLSPADESE